MTQHAKNGAFMYYAFIPRDNDVHSQEMKTTVILIA